MYMRKIYSYLIKSLMCIILFLGLGIFCKLDINYKKYIQKELYQKHFDFSSAKNFCDKYLGGIFPLEHFSNSGVIKVFNEELIYYRESAYEDGVLLTVDYNYLIPIIESGIVVYIGKKDKYNNVVIVEGDNGIDIWYGNVCNVMVNLYDTIKGGEYIGDVCDNKLYIVYTKNNEFLDYKEYLN